jgi:hypothetical protein
VTQCVTHLTASVFLEDEDVEACFPHIAAKDVCVTAVRADFRTVVVTTPASIPSALSFVLSLGMFEEESRMGCSVGVTTTNRFMRARQSNLILIRQLLTCCLPP